MNRVWLEKLIRESLHEDVGYGDLTTESLVTEKEQGRAILIAKEKGVIAGLPVAEEVFRQLDPDVTFTLLIQEGDEVKPGTRLAQVHGTVRGLLTGERLALNFLQRLSGIATITQQVVQQLEGLDCQVLDTRKTTPGLRFLEKYAVKVGGGTNHRFGLSHGVLIKDNHVAIAGGIREAVYQVRRKLGDRVQVEVEADTLEQVREALEQDVDAILLDNMDPETLCKAVSLIGDQVWTEASGGITPETARKVAESGVKGISLGWLTHSTPALDISLDMMTKEEAS
ncbi:carboxylating nicotinate-nucleotide diphosphorylase [Kroppenstedtia pulmonis]|uniref:Probable nicotinate-nucleotide pyrophosphorylase [carboxylating] n=1 Tax=Kroppenstedtia pulmonis TaxID=1380685 RepID=A0A7D3Y366_9BACL|nr:carboxylating nicotinate-nucleotide diphosphorylase [Kroppenstedtia pulmonis]QKG85343.1 carboxylating nicotinate-nucleotide diphosphorylase [Kroppenstedtia pulmonis]